MSEFLEFPEYSVIAMYKKWIIGVALMTPSGYISYFLVHPDFQQSSIGSILLFLLIQVRNLFFGGFSQDLLLYFCVEMSAWIRFDVACVRDKSSAYFIPKIRI